jgi:hypothetical protein
MRRILHMIRNYPFIVLSCVVLVLLSCGSQDKEDPKDAATGGRCESPLLSISCYSEAGEVLTLDAGDWTLEVLSVSVKDSLAVYWGGAGATLHVPISGSGMPMMVGSKSPDGEWYLFTVSMLRQEQAKLCVLECAILNCANREEIFRIGDILFHRSNGEQASIVAVGTGPYAIAKMSEEARTAALGAEVTIGPGKIQKVIYVLIIDEDETQLNICFGNRWSYEGDSLP